MPWLVGGETMGPQSSARVLCARVWAPGTPCLGSTTLTTVPLHECVNVILASLPPHVG